jgi:hypothetical protein
MALFTLDEEHPLTKAGLRFVHVVEQVELGLKPGDVVFEFPYGRIVDTGMACRRERINSAWRRDHDHSQRSDCGSGVLQ